jgi:GT2 family glycosyltransferase
MVSYPPTSPKCLVPRRYPAYFEDNDYYARIVLSGGACRVIHAARLFHHGSLTVKADAEMAHHVQFWFERNGAYFGRKWGVQMPEATAAGVLEEYFRHPFNDATKPLSWFPEGTS